MTQPVTLTIELVKPPEALDALSSFTLMLALDGDASIDLRELRYEVLDGEALIAVGTLGTIIRFDPDASDYDPRNGSVEKRDQAALRLTAPKEIAAFSWRILVPEQEIDGHLVASTAIEFHASTLVHRSSLVAWDVPSPVLPGEKFRAKIGGKCSAGCNLCARSVMICDAAGEAVATAAFQYAHQEAEGLWWGEVEMTAPQETGLQKFSIHFAPGDAAGLPHQAAETQFSIMVADAPDHAVDVCVVDEESGEPLHDAYVRLGLYRVATQPNGLARFAVPKGEHRLFIWKAGFDIPEKQLVVEADLSLTIAAKALPKKDPYERWQG